VAGSGAALEELPPEKCLELMARQPIGRIAVADPGAAPMVVPVNFFVDGDTVVFRTDPGSKFGLAVLDGRPVSFEVDSMDAGRHGGWSVLLRGTASEIDEPADERISLRAWAPGAKSHWVRIVPDVISGRRIRPAAGLRWTWTS
jgi:nitroimidazol reductase NimA-like FMN-containing flavoprotein (pyridoxamine 5'-phosphate oxidase superfamily)